MKTFVACLLLGLFTATLAEVKKPLFVFPPFSGDDIKFSVNALPDYPTYEEMKAISVEEWRGYMTSGDLSVQDIAAKELMARGDQKTILRLVYSLKQGNAFAIETLSESSLTVIPFLMEDVANGSLEYYEGYDFGDSGISGGRVRQAAVERVASILFGATEFTDETRECLRSIGRGNSEWVQGLSDEARYLVQWWLLNQDTFEAGKWDEVKPLPEEIIYGDPKDDILFPRGGRWSSEKQPPYGSPLWELAEPFEVWAARIVDPKRCNLEFVALSWDGKKVVEHPAKSLDPKAKQEDRQSRKSPAPRTLTNLESVDRKKGISWIKVAALLICALSILWLVRRKLSNGL